ncbi:MAG: hypothetical protein AAGE52_01490 [Myxococcota bacterium]
MDWRPGFDRFAARVRARLEAGEREYGNSALTKPDGVLLGEIQEELEDVMGWTSWLWMRMEQMRALLNGKVPLGTLSRGASFTVIEDRYSVGKFESKGPEYRPGYWCHRERDGHDVWIEATQLVVPL